MNKKWIVAVVMVTAMAVGLVVGLGRGPGASTAAFAGQAAEPIRVVGEDGKVMDLWPLVVVRDGEAREIDSFGTWSLKRLGYSDLVFPCTDRFEAVQMEYILPEDAAQGPDKLYALALNFHIEFAHDSQDGYVEVTGLTNGAICTSASFDIIGSDKGLVVTWTDVDGTPKSTSSLAADVSRVDFLRGAHLVFNGVKPGLNTLTITLAQYGGAVVKSLRISGSSGIQLGAVSDSAQAGMFASLSRLSPEDEAKAKSIAMGDARIQGLIQGRDYEITLVAPCDWGPPGAGDARVDIRFKVAHQIEYDWPWPPTPVRTELLSGNFWVREMTIAIDLEQEAITGISPVGQPLQGEKAPGPEIPALTEEEKAKAKEIALADATVKELITGKQYKVGQKYDEATPDTRVGVVTEDLVRVGAALEIWFDHLYTITYWPSAEYDAGSGTYQLGPPEPLSVQGLTVFVNLDEARVYDVVPL